MYDHENKINHNKTESTIQELISQLNTNEIMNNITKLFYNSMNELKCKPNVTEIKPNFGRNIKKEVINEIKSNETDDNNNLPQYSSDVINIKNDSNQDDDESEGFLDDFDDIEDREVNDDEIIEYNYEINDHEQRDEQIIDDKINESMNITINEIHNKLMDVINNSTDELNDDPEKVNIHLKVLPDEMEEEKIMDMNRYNYTTLNDDHNLTSITSPFTGIFDFFRIFSSNKNNNNKIVHDEKYVKLNLTTFNMTEYFDAKHSEVIYSNDEENTEMAENEFDSHENEEHDFEENEDTELNENK